MSEQPSQPQRPTTDNPDAWKAYWEALGTPWRTEPEIDKERQRYLDERRAIKPDSERGIYPFGGVRLSRADVEWLLTTHQNGRWLKEMTPGHSFEEQSSQRGLDLRGADLRGAKLYRMPLAELRGGLDAEEWFGASMEKREAAAIHLEGAALGRSDLVRSNLRAAHLEGAVLSYAYLRGATLRGAHLGGRLVRDEEPQYERAHKLNGEMRLPAADLRLAHFDEDTALDAASLGSNKYGFVQLADIRWGAVNLANLDWTEKIPGPFGNRIEAVELGDELEARDKRDKAGKKKDRGTRRDEYKTAVRTNRQLATVLRQQGLTEDADRFAYRAHICQRRVLRLQRDYQRYLGLLFLGLISGYGYRPKRSAATYLLVVIVFGLAYWALGVQTGHTLTWNEAAVVSLTAFHGRGFFATAFQPGDPQAALAAIEAVIGLLIEITFIATFTQRFFAR